MKETLKTTKSKDSYMGRVRVGEWRIWAWRGYALKAYCTMGVWLKESDLKLHVHG